MLWLWSLTFLHLKHDPLICVPRCTIHTSLEPINQWKPKISPKQTRSIIFGSPGQKPSGRIGSRVKNHDTVPSLICTVEDEGGNYNNEAETVFLRVKLYIPLHHFLQYYCCCPSPVGGRGIVFGRFLSFFLSFFVSLSATLRENGWTDLHEIFREGVEWQWNDLVTFWVNSGKRVGGSKVNLFVIKITASRIGHLVCTRLVAAVFVHWGLALTSQYHSLGGSRGGVCCASACFFFVRFTLQWTWHCKDQQSRAVRTPTLWLHLPLTATWL